MTNKAPTATPDVHAFFDTASNTISYVVVDSETRECAIIDPVLGFDPASCRTDTGPVDPLLAFVQEHGFKCRWLIDTHVHADHLSALAYLRDTLGGTTAIGKQLPVVQRAFGNLFNEPGSFARDASQFDHLFEDGEHYQVGNIEAVAIATPGHTPACMSHLIGDAVFVGDTLFMPDYGTARCDFPGGSAQTLFESVQKLYALPDATRMFLCHDYKAPGRDDYCWETSVGEQKRRNVHLSESTSDKDFVAMRTARDATLSVPRLMLPSVQVNMRAGALPRPESNGTSYLKLPVNVL